MNGTIKELWLIVECPHCKRPKVKNRYISKDTLVVKPLDVRCDFCDKPFTIDLKVLTIESMDNR